MLGIPVLGRWKEIEYILCKLYILEKSPGEKKAHVGCCPFLEKASKVDVHSEEPTIQDLAPESKDQDNEMVRRP